MVQKIIGNYRKLIFWVKITAIRPIIRKYFKLLFWINLISFEKDVQILKTNLLNFLDNPSRDGKEKMDAVYAFWSQITKYFRAPKCPICKDTKIKEFVLSNGKIEAIFCDHCAAETPENKIPPEWLPPMEVTAYKTDTSSTISYPDFLAGIIPRTNFVPDGIRS